MKVRMRMSVRGRVAGDHWSPRRGDVIEVPDAAGASLCAKGFAEPVVEPKPVEKAVKPDAEKRERKPRRSDRGAADAG